MPQDINKRLLVERSFIERLLREHKTTAPSTLFKMSRINSSSSKYPLKNNVMTDSCFIDIVRTKKLIKGAGLLGAISPEDLSNRYDGSDEDTKIIKRAIDLASSYPWKVAILTTSEKKVILNSNPHYNSDEGITESISICDFDESLALIEELAQIIIKK